ncbi:MAG TPA: hypothetical protein VGR37_14585 [Longimicrobiaceae bacterium]|nr:hypothetical protein [Longimicrobiaceae bacterium]
MLRSLAAILVGFVLIGGLALGADVVLRAALPGAFDASGRVDDVPVLLLMMGYVGLFAVTGCYLAARLAPGRPMLHALVLGVLGLAFNVAGTLAMWETAPAWFHFASLLLVMPYAWVGGRLREVELKRRGAEAAAVAAA